MNYNWWTLKEIDSCKKLYNNGNTIKDIAIKLDRCELSVENLLVTERVIIK